MSLPKFFSPQKAPADSIPYGMDWQDWFKQNAKEIPSLAGDSIASAVITASPDGLTIGSVTIDPTGMICYATVSGGVDGTDYVLACEITSQAGLVAVSEQTILCRAAAR